MTKTTYHSGSYRPNLAVKDLNGRLVATSSRKLPSGEITFWSWAGQERVTLSQEEFYKKYRLEELR